MATGGGGDGGHTAEKTCAGCVESQVSRMSGLLLLGPELDRHRLGFSLDTMSPLSARLNHWPGLLEQDHISTNCPRVGVHPLTVQHMVGSDRTFTATLLMPENSWVTSVLQVSMLSPTPPELVMHCCCPFWAVWANMAGLPPQGGAAMATGGGGAGGQLAVKICSGTVVSQTSSTNW